MMYDAEEQKPALVPWMFLFSHILLKKIEIVLFWQTFMVYAII